MFKIKNCPLAYQTVYITDKLITQYYVAIRLAVFSQGNPMNEFSLRLVDLFSYGCDRLTMKHIARQVFIELVPLVVSLIIGFCF
jgi:hypothetical protein